MSRKYIKRAFLLGLAGVLVWTLAIPGSIWALPPQNGPELVSVNNDGQVGDNSSWPVNISNDGRYVLFASRATNMGSARTNTESYYVHDRETNQTQLVNVSSDGTEQNGTNGPWTVMSGDGRHVLFTSTATNLDPAAPPNNSNAYLRNLDTGVTSIVSVLPDGMFATNAQIGSISDDGQVIAFSAPSGIESYSNSYIRDLTANQTIQVPFDQVYNNGLNNPGSGGSRYLSGDGRYLAYPYLEAGLARGHIGVVYDRLTNATVTIPDDLYQISDISQNGHYLILFDGHGNWFRYDHITGASIALPHTDHSINISPDGQKVVYPARTSENSPYYMFVYDIPTQNSLMASVTADGQPVHIGVSATGDLSNEGTLVFSSNATSLGPTSNCVGSRGQTIICSQVYAASALMSDDTPPVVDTVTWSANPLLEGQTTTLTASAGDNIGVTGMNYRIDGGPAQQMTYDSGSSTWSASLGSNLGVNTYNVEVFAVDAAGNQSLGKADVLVVYNAANGYVTGHEILTPSITDTIPIASDTATNNPTKMVIGFTNVKAATSTTPSSGSFDVRYVVKNNKDEFNLSSTGVYWLVVPDSIHASILGRATLTTIVNGVQTITPDVTVRFDVTLGTNGAPDHMTIKIFSAGVDPNSGTPTWTVNDDTISNISHLMIKP